MKHPVYAMCGIIISLLIILYSFSLYRLYYDVDLKMNTKNYIYKKNEQINTRFE